MFISSSESGYTINTDEVNYKININKASGTDKISTFIIKNCMSSLLSIIKKQFEISAINCMMRSPWKLEDYSCQ